MNKSIYLLILTCMLFVSCSNPIVADVDGLKITSRDVRNAVEIEKLKFDPIILKTSANQKILKQVVLEGLIQEAILLKEAKSNGISVSKKELDDNLKTLSVEDVLEKQNISTRIWKDRQYNRMIIQKLINKEIMEGIPVDDAEIKAYFKQNQKEFEQPTQFRARQIVVDAKEQADNILKRIKDGEDFAKLAEEYSLSPDRARGGDLGFFNVSTFPPVFAEICSQLKIGETSDVVATDYGYQIFQLLDKRAPHKLALEEVRDNIESIIREKKGEKAFEEWFEKLRDNTHITVNQKALEEINVF